MSVVCGIMADAADSKISNPPVTFESNRNPETSQVPSQTSRLWLGLGNRVTSVSYAPLSSAPLVSNKMLFNPNMQHFTAYLSSVITLSTVMSMIHNHAFTVGSK